MDLDDIDYIVCHDDGSQIECSSPFRYGVMINKKIHVTQGPLMDMDDYIVKYDKHNRLATLNLSFLNQIWKVGVTIPE